MLTKEEILSKLDIRDILLEENEEKADLIEDEITESIIDNYDEYSVDFIIETLTRFGQAPQVIYDDCGMFAVTGTGMGMRVLSEEPIDLSITAIATKEEWFSTIRAALWDYLKR